MVKRSKKQNIPMLLELERLIETNGDKKRIAELRSILGLNDHTENIKDFPAESFWRMRAMQLSTDEIAFALKISPNKVYKYINSLTEEETDAWLNNYSKHRVVLRHLRKRNKIMIRDGELRRVLNKDELQTFNDLINKIRDFDLKESQRKGEII